MSSVTLSKKNQEIYELIPKEFKRIIINSILTKAASNGELIKELSFFIPINDVEEIMSKMPLEGIEFKKTQTFYNNKRPSKSIKAFNNKKRASENLEKFSANSPKYNEDGDNLEDIFIGFD